MNTDLKTSIKGKIIAIAVVCIIALVSSYFVNKFAFREIQYSVQDLAHTNKKLISVNRIFFEVNESEKMFRNLLTTDTSVTSFINQSQKIKSFTDSLRSLCIANIYQLQLIDSISQLLVKREKFLLNYVDFRRKLNSSSPLLQRAAILDSLLSTEALQVDSIVYANERNKSTIHTETVMMEDQQQKKNLWRRIFGSKKKDSLQVSTVVEIEENSKIDTIIEVRRNNVMQEAQRIIEEIKQEQANRKKLFLTREISLNNFESSFHSQITGLLAEIEKDITQKTALTNYEAEQSISKSIRRILGILACFFVFLLIILLLLLEDVTKSNKYRRLLEQAKKEAERQSRYWQRFLSNMSHELRTPLQVIIGYAEQLKKQGKPQEEVAIIHDSSEHLLQVINEILDYNRISSGKFGLNRMPFNLHQVLTEVLSMVHIHAARKGLQLSSNIEELNDGNYFTGDPVRLKQILLNLLGNAIKFTQKGQVQLQIKSTKCEDDNHLFTFRVKDTGPGIPPDMQRVIFQRFETLDTIANQQYNGSGLGLSITKALIEVQGGTMILESEEGKGSCFTFQLKYPVAVAEHISMPSPSPSVVHSSARVWVVDDDPLILRLCSSILNAHNIDSKCFPNGSALLNQHSGQQPSVFLIDIRMFDMNGFELYKSIRSRYGSDVPVIAITAQALPEELEEILRHGFNDILLKPFKEEELLIMINKWSDSTAATIKQMPFNTDQEYAEDIWEQYVLETTHDIHTLEAAADGKDIDTATMMLHRIAGRTAQVGNKELGRAFRKMELNVRSSSRINLEELQELIARLRSDLQQ